MSRRIVITGGGSGLGLAIAKRHLAEGARVAICDEDISLVKRASENYEIAISVCADVSDSNQMKDFHNNIIDEFGGVDVMYANAGVGGPAGPIDEIDHNEWKRCIEVNLFGAFYSASWASRIMKVQKNGCIIFTSSTSGLFGVPNRSPYVAAKWGIVGLTKSMAMELGDYGVRVNAICPGAVSGDRMKRVLSMESKASGISEDDLRRVYSEGTSMRSFVSEENVADMALFLASDQASMITGQAMAVDGYTERTV